MISREPIFSIRCELANILDLGPAPFGHRRVVNIVGGPVTGAKLTGRVLPGGADWQIMASDGALDPLLRLEPLVNGILPVAGGEVGFCVGVAVAVAVAVGVAVGTSVVGLVAGRICTSAMPPNFTSLFGFEKMNRIQRALRLTV